MFLLAHELGHVAIHHGLLPASPVNEKLRADTVGCGIMFDLAKSHQIDPTEVYGAAVLALRICAGLEHVGVRFSGAYPEHEEERVESLREEVISHCCPSMQYFHEISRIAAAYEDQMDDVESHFCKTCRSPNSERILVLLIAELLDMAQGRLALRKFSERLLALSGQTPSEILQSSYRKLYKYYVDAPPTHSFIDPYMRQRMGSVLVEMTKHLPTTISALFGN
jgi:hypothetical protein